MKALDVGPITQSREAPAQWEAMLQATAQPRDGLHVTDLLGCPRKHALVASGATAELGRLEAATWGIAMHRLFEGPDKTVSERNVTVKLDQPVSEARLASASVVRRVVLAGRMDSLIDGVVSDYKFPNADSFIKMVRYKEWPKPEHVWQVEMYRLGLAQEGVKTVGGEVRYGAHTAGKWPCWLRARWTSPVQDESALLAFRPFDSSWTVAARLDQLVSEAPAETLPLVGLTCSFGKKTQCDYCEVEEACKTLVDRTVLEGAAF